MATFEGYILMTKPAALSMADWRTSLLALYQALNRHPLDNQPYRRLHSRLSIDNTQIIIVAAFDTGDITLDQLATYIANALGGKYTKAQVKTAITNNVTIWNTGWDASGDACRSYLIANAASWEPALA